MKPAPSYRPARTIPRPWFEEACVAAVGSPWLAARVERERREVQARSDNAEVLRLHGGVTDSVPMLAQFPRTVWPRPWSPQDYQDYCDTNGVWS